mgnify:CR=1 FL=1
MNHPINDFFKTSSNSIKDIANVDMIVGKSMYIDENISLIPISEVKISFANGGMETCKDGCIPYGGASAATVTLKPVCFILRLDDEVKLLHVNEETHLIEKLVDEGLKIGDSLKNYISKKIDSN